MEADAARGGSSRKEWCAVSEHSPFPNDVNEEGTGSVDLLLSDEIMKKRIEDIARQREDLQDAEIKMRAQIIASSEILEVQNRFHLQINEHVDAASELKDKLQDREHLICELELKLEEKEREIHAVKLDNEAAWAKDDLLREQNKELATFRRQHDNFEAERAQHLKEIHDLQEHVQEKESQILSLEEQHRVAQETILFKDEQLREAQIWIARVQEMDALQSTTLQAHLQERTEQFNQYWIGIQQQFAEVERHHLHAIQQLQLELAEEREQNGVYKDGTKVNHQNLPDSSSYIQSKGNQINAYDVGALNGKVVFMSNGNPGGHPDPSSSSVSSETEHPAGIAVIPSPSQRIPQSHLSHFQPMSSTPHQHLQQDQARPDVSKKPNQNNFQPSKTEQNLRISDAHYSYELPAEPKIIHPDHPSVHVDQQHRSGFIINGSSNEDKVVLESNGKQYQMSGEPQQTSTTSAPIHAILGYASQEKESAVMVHNQNRVSAINRSQEQLLASAHQRLNCTDINLYMPEHTKEPTFLDERSFLACIVRAIPAGANGRIRISTTLPNRLAKMLAPLHWHDYKKRYGKLDDFVAHHPELFVIEGDFIHLREGAQEIISATTAFVKVAAAAASSAPFSASLSSIALTPVAHSNRQLNGGSFNIARGLSDMKISVKSKTPQEVNGLPSEVRKAHSPSQNAGGNGASNGLSNGGGFSSGGKQSRSAAVGIISRR